MIAVYIIAGLMALCIAFLQIRLRLWAEFGERLCLTASVAGRSISLYPGKIPSAVNAAPKITAAVKGKEDVELSTEDVIALLRAAMLGLERMVPCARRRVRIEPFSLCVVTGGDPADAAQLYGYLSGAVFTVMPRLESLFRIPDPRIHLDVDYTAEKTKAEGSVGIRLRIADALAVGFAVAWPVWKWFIRRKRMKITPPPEEKNPRNDGHAFVA